MVEPVKLRTKKRLVNLASLVIAASAVAIVIVASRCQPPIATIDGVRAPGKSVADRVSHAQIALNVNSPSWQRVLRRPLYDPPPPTPPPVIVQQRPITVKLVGTVIEPDNSQAFVRQASGSVELKRTGDQVTSDAADGVIAEITATSILIRRPDGEHQVAVEGNN